MLCSILFQPKEEKKCCRIDLERRFLGESAKLFGTVD